MRKLLRDICENIFVSIAAFAALRCLTCWLLEATLFQLPHAFCYVAPSLDLLLPGALESPLACNRRRNATSLPQVGKYTCVHINASARAARLQACPASRTSRLHPICDGIRSLADCSCALLLQCVKHLSIGGTKARAEIGAEASARAEAEAEEAEEAGAAAGMAKAAEAKAVERKRRQKGFAPE